MGNGKSAPGWRRDDSTGIKPVRLLVRDEAMLRESSDARQRGYDVRVSNYRELRVWQSAMQLSRDCYRITSPFPRSERYGLTGQIRRAAVSVVANIAEGNGRFTRPDYIRHLGIANGSLRELETLLQLAHGLGLVSGRDFDSVRAASEATGRMLVALVKRLRG